MGWVYRASERMEDRMIRFADKLMDATVDLLGVLFCLGIWAAALLGVVYILISVFANM
jgi:hypothetical protein